MLFTIIPEHLCILIKLMKSGWFVKLKKRINKILRNRIYIKRKKLYNSKY